MSVSAIVILLAFVAISVTSAIMPFFRRHSAEQDPKKVAHQKQRAELVSSYERTLAVIRDMDEDYQVGKLAKEEYELNRGRWAEQGVKLLQSIEALDGHKSEERAGKPQRTANKPNQADKALDDAIEQAVAAYTKALSGGQD
jgi:hypothetical protein